MTEVQSSSFGEPALLLDDPMNIQNTYSPFSVNATKTRSRGTTEGFMANGLLGDASSGEEDASMLDVDASVETRRTEVEDVGFGGALLTL